MPGTNARSAAFWVGLGLFLYQVLLVTAPGSAGTLDATWTAPTTNADGSPLTDLASYRLYYNTSSSPCAGSSSVQVASPTSSPGPNQTMSFKLSGLTTGTLYHVGVSAVNASGLQSACSSVDSAVARADFSVSPTGTVNFGSVALGGTAERTFTVSNTGGGTLSGAASVSAPFSIVSGSPFTLGGVGATQAVIVRFKPTTAATVTTNLNFTAGGSAISSIVTGSGSTVVNSAAAPSLSLVVTGNPSTTAPYAVEAQTNRTSVRVRFYVNNVLFRTENIAKYCLFGGGDGGALCTTGRLGNGTRTVQAQLHDAVTGALLATTSKTIVEGTPSPTLTLVVTGMPSAGSPYAVQAQTTQTSGVRVRFYRNGTLVRTESVAKFCLFGGGDGATVPCNTGKFGTGTHAIEVRVHSTSNDALLAKANITIVEGP